MELCGPTPVSPTVIDSAMLRPANHRGHPWRLHCKYRSVRWSNEYHERTHRHRHRRGRLPGAERRDPARWPKRPPSAAGKRSASSAATRASSSRSGTVELEYQKLGSLLTRGGTILGTANRGRFSAKVGHGETRRLPQELIDGVQAGMQKLNIRGLVTIGGDGSLSIGQQLFEGGVPLVGVPKTIDNDLEGTAMTFGFDSAVACAPPTRSIGSTPRPRAITA